MVGKGAGFEGDSAIIREVAATYELGRAPRTPEPRKARNLPLGVRTVKITARATAGEAPDAWLLLQYIRRDRGPTR